MQYEYEMFFDDTSPVSIHGWWPIATDRIKDQSKIQEYIDKGILRRIDMKEQDAAHSFEKFKGHTPGPWEIDDYKQGILYTHDTGFKFHICLIGSGGSTTMSDEEEIANLALIAEAPNLLAELTSLRSELQQKDEIIKWMLPIVERHVYLHGNDDSVVDRKSIIAQAKELLKNKAK